MVDGKYQIIQVGEDGDGVLRGHSDILELDVCVRLELELKLYDPATGTWLRNLDEAEDALAETETVLAETARQNEAQAERIRELEALLSQQGIEPPGASA